MKAFSVMWRDLSRSADNPTARWDTGFAFWRQCVRDARRNPERLTVENWLDCASSTDKRARMLAALNQATTQPEIMAVMMHEVGIQNPSAEMLDGWALAAERIAKERAIVLMRDAQEMIRRANQLRGEPA